MKMKSLFLQNTGKRPPLNIYRTDEAVFIHRPPASYNIRHSMSLMLRYVSLPLLAFMLVMLPLRNAPLVLPDDIIALLFVFLGCTVLLPLLFGIANKEQYLLRIDAKNITLTRWIFARTYWCSTGGSTRSIKRPKKLNLFYKPQLGWCFEPAKGNLILFKANDWEIAFIRKVLDEFEREVPAGSETGLTVEPWYSVLETMLCNGKPLVKLSNVTAETPKNETGKITVLCPRCNAAVDNLTSPQTKGVDIIGTCPVCGTVFEVAGLKLRKPPKHCRTTFTEDEVRSAPALQTALRQRYDRQLPLFYFFLCLYIRYVLRSV